MSSLKDKLQDDLTIAIKARDDVRTRTLRMALTAVTNEEKAGKQSRELSDEDLIKVLAREAKKRREAAAAFAEAGRDEQAQAERDEQEVLAEYLPAELSEQDLVALVTEAIKEIGAEGPRAMGQVMKIVNPAVAGRAEGGRVAAEVRRQLGG